MNKVYIILVNWNGWHDTIECLESLLLLEYRDFHIVVCDNGSQDDSVVHLRGWCEQTFSSEPRSWQMLNREAAESCDGDRNTRITLVVNGENLGFGGGTNVGLRFAMARGDADFCWLLNNDTVVDAGALAPMVRRMHDKPDACMCGSTLRDYGSRSRIQALGGAVYYKWPAVAWHIGRTISGTVLPDRALVENKMDYVIGASLLVRSGFMEEAGLLAEDYFLYFEEIDWYRRARGQYTLAYAPDSIVYHKVGASIGTATNPVHKSLTCDFYTLRNRIIFTRRYFPYALPGVYLFLIAELMVRLLVGRVDLALMVCRLLSPGGSKAESP